MKAVIGAGFGDEGKGLMTDYLASQLEHGIVVRFNGGAQAGHTVVTPDGKRHVFGHVGAGTFAGLPTYLSRFFVANPMLFRKELASLQACCSLPTVYLDPRCPVTTPYDMIVNQVVELARGDARHGSCGVGFNETVTRTQVGPALFAADLADAAVVLSTLRRIRDEYVPHRLRQLGVNSVPGAYARLLRDDGICERYLEDVRVLLGATAIADHRIFSSFEAVIFEGAQGLFLDETHRFFPYVTRSRTGLHNVVRLLGEAGLDGLRLEVVYVTRTYLTRHGPGPFPTETGDRPYPGVEDLTNLPNPYQGVLRFGLLDLDAMTDAVRADLRFAQGLDLSVRIAITCLDQVGGPVRYVAGGREAASPADDFVLKVLDSVGVGGAYLGWGPTRCHVSVYR